MIRLFSILILAVAGAVVLSAQCPAGKVKSDRKLDKAKLPSRLQFAIQEHGDRLLKPGKERIQMTGLLSRKKGADVPFQLVQELPDLIRIDIQGANGAETLAFDGEKQWQDKGALKKEDGDLLEALIYDTPERFFQAQANSVPMRSLGSGFRLDGQIGRPYSGPVYDIYTIVDTIKGRGNARPQTKYYFVNSSTHLLERVEYNDTSNGDAFTQMHVEGWLQVGSDRAPRVIRRLENGTETARLSVNSFTLGPTRADSIFCMPGK